MAVVVRTAVFIRAAPLMFAPNRGNLTVCRKLNQQRRVLTIQCRSTTGASVNAEYMPTNGDYVTIMSHSGRIVRSAWRDAFMRTKNVVAIDATAGRGSDTLSLCEIAGSDGVVHAVDVQAAALVETRARYDAACGGNIALAVLHTHRGNHENLRTVTGLTGGVAAIAYNLGWYPAPGADRSIITRAESTIRSLQSATELVSSNGVISIMAYVGHEGGREEADSVRVWAANLDRSNWSVVHLAYPNRRQAPELFLLQRAAARPQA